MKLFVLSFFALVSSFAVAQEDTYTLSVLYSNNLAINPPLTQKQKMELKKIDLAYLKEADGKRHRAETGYNDPKHIQYQHVMNVLRRFEAMKQILSEEQYLQIRNAQFDIYPHREWMQDFYRKNKLPTIEEAVRKKEEQLTPKSR